MQVAMAMTAVMISKGVSIEAVKISKGPKGLAMKAVKISKAQ